MSRLNLPLLPSNYQVCDSCGQTHEASLNHVYDYPDEVEEELQCRICLQPLVDAVDTPCCHTFCRICLNNHLKQSLSCPMDRKPVRLKDVRPSSLLVQKLLDKLLIVCPNNGYCDAVMHRSLLEEHLKVHCPGMYVECPRKSIGCEHYGPRCNLEEHLWSCGLAPDRSKDGIPLPLLEEQVTLIEIPKGMADLGIKLRSPQGADLGQNWVVIDNVFPDGNVAKDGRLRPGDRILKVNDMEVSSQSLAKAALVMGTTNPLIQLTVKRPKGSNDEMYETIVVVIHRLHGQALGLRIMARKHHDGVFVLGVVAGSPADKSGMLQKGDHLLEINGQDMRRATVDVVAQTLTDASGDVTLVVERLQTGGSASSRSDLTSYSSVSSQVYDEVPRRHASSSSVVMPTAGQDRVVLINKKPDESFGMSISGGLGSECGDLPIFVTTVLPNGIVGRTGQVKRGDIILSMNDKELVNKTHAEAVLVIKSLASASFVRMSMIQGEESTENIPPPEWKDWVTQAQKKKSNPGSNRMSNGAEYQVVNLNRPPGKSLGFSIVGGKRSPKGDCPVYIKSLAPMSIAESDGRLHCGDELVAVNNIRLVDFSQQEVVRLIRDLSGPVSLTIRTIGDSPDH